MYDVNLMRKILEDYANNGLHDISVVVGIWKFDIDDLPIGLKVKVVRYANGKYTGIANYYIQNYLSMRYCDTVEQAIDDALGGFLSMWNPEDKDKIEFRAVENW